MVISVAEFAGILLSITCVRLSLCLPVCSSPCLSVCRRLYIFTSAFFIFCFLISSSPPPLSSPQLWNFFGLPKISPTTVLDFSDELFRSLSLFFPLVIFCICPPPISPPGLPSISREGRRGVGLRKRQLDYLRLSFLPLGWCFGSCHQERERERGRSSREKRRSK